MKNRFISHLLLLPLLLLCACGGGDSFNIIGEIEGAGTQNIYVVYYGDGSLKNYRTAAIDGKFSVEGSSRDLTAIYIFSNAKILQGIAIAKNGDAIQVKFNKEDFSQSFLKGNRQSEQLSEWLKENAAVLAEKNNKEAVNDAVKRFVEKNQESITSTVLLVNFYDSSINPAEADSLLHIVDSKSRPSYLAEGWSSQIQIATDSLSQMLPEQIELLDVNDSLISLSTRGVTTLLYLPHKQERVKAIDRRLSELVKNDTLDNGRLLVTEIDYHVTDTGTWKNYVRDESFPWKHTWHPSLPSIIPFGTKPQFIVADSTGVIIYNGTKVEDAVAATGR